MREAFAKLGFRPWRPARPESKPPPRDLQSMTGAQIDAAVRELERKVRRITADLNEDMANGASALTESLR
jgi:hypothetical protein